MATDELVKLVEIYAKAKQETENQATLLSELEKRLYSLSDALAKKLLPKGYSSDKIYCFFIGSYELEIKASSMLEGPRYIVSITSS